MSRSQIGQARTLVNERRNRFDQPAGRALSGSAGSIEKQQRAAAESGAFDKVTSIHRLRDGEQSQAFVRKVREVRKTENGFQHLSLIQIQRVSFCRPFRPRTCHAGRISEAINRSAAVLIAAALDSSKSSFSRQKRDHDSQAGTSFSA